MLDLDRFKAINDQLGHVAGDRVLRSVAGALSGAVRTGDGVYRYGGEECVVLTKVSGPDEASFAAHRLRAAVAALRIPHPGNPPHDRVTLSVGVATVGQADLASDEEEWFARADAALYRAKASGRNAVEFGASPERAWNGTSERLSGTLTSPPGRVLLQREQLHRCGQALQVMSTPVLELESAPTSQGPRDTRSTRRVLVVCHRWRMGQAGMGRSRRTPSARQWMGR